MEHYLLFLFGNWEIGIQILFTCMVLYYILGIMCGTKKKELSSNREGGDLMTFDVVLGIHNEETDEFFKIGDVVKLYLLDGKYFNGKITLVDYESFVIDCSSIYGSNSKTFLISNIKCIELETSGGSSGSDYGFIITDEYR